MDLIAAKTPYRELRDSINARIEKVLDHGGLILSPEMAELEGRLARTVKVYVITSYNTQV
jgi:UDP-2-acetamido-2-deoxy-ribo-hexuluronate aminotransferase